MVNKSQFRVLAGLSLVVFALLILKIGSFLKYEAGIKPGQVLTEIDFKDRELSLGKFTVRWDSTLNQLSITSSDPFAQPLIQSVAGRAFVQASTHDFSFHEAKGSFFLYYKNQVILLQNLL